MSKIGELVLPGLVLTTDSVDKAVEEIEVQARELHVRKRMIRAEAARALRLVDARLDALAEAKKMLRADARRERRRATRRELSPVDVAGRGNVEAVFGFLRDHGPARQAGIARGLGKNSGTVSYAIQALEEEGRAVRLDSGEVRATGRRRVLKPGS